MTQRADRQRQSFCPSFSRKRDPGAFDCKKLKSPGSRFLGNDGCAFSRRPWSVLTGTRGWFAACAPALLLLGLLLPGAGLAQDAAAPVTDAEQSQMAQRPSEGEPPPPAQPQTTGDLLQALPGEAVLLPQLRALVLAPELTPRPQASGVVLALEGIDGLQSPQALQPLQALLAPAIGQPVSQGSLGRIQTAARIYFRAQAQRVVSVSLPPQDITDGVVTLLVRPTRLEGEVAVEGNRWFGAGQYRDGLVLTDQGVDAAAIERQVAWLNRNPYRRVTPELSPGDEPGTTRVTLRVQEQFPFRFSAGYDNTGTPSTDENRVFVSAEWGNAFWSGGVLGYTFRADPNLEFLQSHLLNGTWWMSSGKTLTAFAAYNQIQGDLPAPFDQGGTSWQVGTRYSMPRAVERDGFSDRFTVGFDFKSSDNNLLFGGMPVIDSLTHVAQLTLGYAADWQAAGRATGLSTTLFLSPGGLTGANEDADFNDSQFGAQAQYAYATARLNHQRRLAGDFGWRLQGNAQLASAHLLSSEQIAGGGVSAVRGYGEALVFADNGAVVRNDLILPPIPAVQGLQLYLFHDIGRLWNSDEPTGGIGSIDLHSLGAGLRYQPGAHFDLSASYGQQIESLSAAGDRARWHLSATVRF